MILCNDIISHKAFNNRNTHKMLHDIKKLFCQHVMIPAVSYIKTSLCVHVNYTRVSIFVILSSFTYSLFEYKFITYFTNMLVCTNIHTCQMSMTTKLKLVICNGSFNFLNINLTHFTYKTKILKLQDLYSL